MNTNKQTIVWNTRETGHINSFDIFTGVVKRVINGTAYTMVFTSYTMMQLCTQWQKYQLRKLEQETRVVGEILKKTGLFTYLTSLVALGQFLFQFALPTKGESLHLAKDLLSNGILFVIIPLIIIANNNKMVRYIHQKVRETRVGIEIENFVEKSDDVHDDVNVATNKVAPSID